MALIDPLDLVALALTFAGAGWILSLLVLPERLGPTVRLWSSLGLAVPATLLVALPLSWLGLLDGPALWLGLGLLALLGVATWRRRRGRAGSTHGAPAGGRSWRRLVTTAWRPLPAVHWHLVSLAGAVVVSWLAVVGPQLASRRADGLPQGTTVWYYWWLVERAVAERGLPATNPEWGADRPFPVEYAATTLHTAATAVLGGGPDLLFLETFRSAVVVLTVFAAYALWRRFLPAWWAFIAALLTLTSEKTVPKLLGYRPETFGFLLVLWSAWLFDQALARRSLRWAVLAGVVSATGFWAHAEVWLLTPPLWAGILVARSVPTLLQAVRARRRLPLAPLAVWLAAVTGFVTVGLGFAVLVGGQERLAEVVGVAGRGTEAAAECVPSDDPTWYLNSVIFRPDELDQPPPQVCRGLLRAARALEPYPGLDVRRPLVVVALALGALLVLVGLRSGPAGPRRGIVAWSIYALGIIAVAQVICLVYDTYVPQRAGPLRVAPYWALAVAGLLPLIAWSAARLLFRLVRALPGARPRPPPRAVSAVITIPLTLALLAPFTHLGRPAVQPQATGISPVVYEAFTWLDANVPSGARILVNGYTPGIVGTMTRRVGWLDGRMPYLESADWLCEAVNAVVTSRAFFADRSGSGAVPEGVDYLVVARRGANIGTPRFAADLAALRRRSDLREIRSFGEESVILFEVTVGDTSQRPAATASRDAVRPRCAPTGDPRLG